MKDKYEQGVYLDKKYKFALNKPITYEECFNDENLKCLMNIFYFENYFLNHNQAKYNFKQTKFWFQKALDVLKEYQNFTLLSGNVFIKEITLSQSKRLPRENANDPIEYKKIIYCIGVGYDGKNFYARVLKNGYPSKKGADECFMRHIDFGSNLYHNNDICHDNLISERGLYSVYYENERFCEDIKGKEHIAKNFHKNIKLLRKFMRIHSDFDRSNLQDYLNLYCFIINPSLDKLDKARYILENTYVQGQVEEVHHFLSRKQEN